jgi:hypothetical protein
MAAPLRGLAIVALSVALMPLAAIGQGAGPQLSPAWPDDAELEARGARIGSIRVRDLPIFEPDGHNEHRALYRLADRLHIDTRDTVIESQLLFEPGDLYSRRRLEETARNLRDLRFIREPEIRIVGYRDGLVDLEVVAHEVWTTNPGASFSRSGGKNSSAIGLEELNVLGFGKHVALDYSNNVERRSYTVRWRDPGVRGTRWRSELALQDSDDGAGKSVVLERPFYALDTRWAAGFEFAQEDSVEPVYRLGEPVARYAQDKDRSEIRFGWSRGLQNGWTRRISVGLRHEQAVFAPAPGETMPAALPADRSLDYPFLRLEGVQDDFETARNRDQIARTEDLHFGLRYAAELGVAAPAFGADRSAAVFRADASRGFRLGKNRSLFMDSRLSGRFESGGLTDGLVSAGCRFYRELGTKSTLFAALNAEVGHALEADHELSIGGDTGLRGYPLRYQSGSSRALLTLEQRFYTNRSLWNLADIGGAIFFDAGRSWGASAFGPTENYGLLKDIGLGLRLGSTRSSLGNVLHIDIAFPLDGPRSLGTAQLLVQTKHSF